MKLKKLGFLHLNCFCRKKERKENLKYWSSIGFMILTSILILVMNFALDFRVNQVMRNLDEWIINSPCNSCNLLSIVDYHQLNEQCQNVTKEIKQKEDKIIQNIYKEDSIQSYLETLTTYKRLKHTMNEQNDLRKPCVEERVKENALPLLRFFLLMDILVSFCSFELCLYMANWNIRNIGPVLIDRKTFFMFWFNCVFSTNLKHFCTFICLIYKFSYFSVDTYLFTC